MANIVPLDTFNFQEVIEHPVRYTVQNGIPWFVAADVCAALEITNVSQAVENLDDDEKNTLSITYGIPGNPNKLHVNESGLYHLIFQSRKEKAKKFRRWVTETVLPSIRKTGSYSARQQLPEPKVVHPHTDHPELTSDEELELVLRYVKHIWERKQVAPTATELRNWVTRLDVKVIRIHLEELADQGEIEPFKTAHSTRYRPA